MHSGCFHGNTCHQRPRREVATVEENWANLTIQAEPSKHPGTCCWATATVSLDFVLGLGEIQSSKSLIFNLLSQPLFADYVIKSPACYSSIQLLPWQTQGTMQPLGCARIFLLCANLSPANNLVSLPVNLCTLFHLVFQE